MDSRGYGYSLCREQSEVTRVPAKHVRVAGPEAAWAPLLLTPELPCTKGRVWPGLCVKRCACFPPITEVCTAQKVEGSSQEWADGAHGEGTEVRTVLDLALGAT